MSGTCKNDTNIIFIISQPRSGSTLLQTLLSQHSEIATTPEPWILLPLLSFMRDNAHEADYNAQAARKAIGEFIEQLPQGEVTYYEGVQKLITHLYDSLLSKTHQTYFVDKTPRYYFIITEIRRLFPNALIILLLRNPLAVLCSQISKTQKQWLMLGNLEHDLITALQNISWAMKQEWENVITIHYEEFLDDPNVLFPIFEMVGLEAPSSLTAYDLPESFNKKDRMGDRNIMQYSSLQVSKSSDWVNTLTDPQIWRLAHDYLYLLGRQLINEIGYDFVDLENTLETHKPGFISRLCTLPLTWFFKHKKIKQAKWNHQFILFFACRLLFFRSQQPYTFRKG